MLLYTQEGAGTFRLSGRDYDLKTGSLLYLDCNKASFTLAASQSLWRTIAFSLGGLFNVYDSLVPFRSFVLWQIETQSPILRDLKQLLVSGLGAVLENKLRDSSLINCILTELFIDAFHLENEGVKCASYLKELKHYIDNHLTASIRLSDLEQRCHMSKYRICHEFSGLRPPAPQVSK